MPIQDEPIPGMDPAVVKKNQFTYESDPAGVCCPLGAHIRRANPRNSDFPERRLTALRKLIIMLGFGPKGFYDDLTSSVRFHRILRRGREYGSELPPEEALQPAPCQGVTARTTLQRCSFSTREKNGIATWVTSTAPSYPARTKRNCWSI